MEKTVRILEQSALSTRKYIDKKSGQEKVMNAVTFKLTDGIDTFLGEVTGERAVNCPENRCRLRRSILIRFQWHDVRIS